MRIDAFCRHVATRAPGDFIARFPHAALVFRAGGGADPGFDTVHGVGPEPETATDLPLLSPHDALVAPEGVAEAVGDELLLDDVQFLVKSTRNPFRDMITVGRSSNNDLVLVQPTVSKVHATFVRDDSGWSIIDPGSTNGTSVDGRRLERGKAARLHDNTRVQLGSDVVAHFFTPLALLDYVQLWLAGVEGA